MIDFKKTYILNGATGTELMKYGYRGVQQEQWILDNKDRYLDICREYKEAGSMVLYSPTFNSNRAKLEREGLADKTAFYNTALAELTKEVGLIVFGNLGPTGLFSKPYGKTTEEELEDIYKQQAEALAKANVDAFIIETMMTMSDAKAAVKACLEYPDVPVIVSCTCDKNGRMMMGNDVLDAARELLDMGISTFGLNCSVGPADLLKQIKRLHQEFPDLPLLAKPNAGLPIKRGDTTCYDCDPITFASYTEEFLNSGVKFFGGCCGTNPEYIRRIKEHCDKLIH